MCKYYYFLQHFTDSARSAAKQKNTQYRMAQITTENHRNCFQKLCKQSITTKEKIYNHYPHLPGLSPTRFIVISLCPAHKHTKDWGRKRNFQIPQYFLNILPMTTIK
jgi:hypothetical protein